MSECARIIRATQCDQTLVIAETLEQVLLIFANRYKKPHAKVGFSMVRPAQTWNQASRTLRT